MEVRMDLSRILIQDGSEHQVIFLRERNGESESAREFPIVIGDPEALAIARQKPTGPYLPLQRRISKRRSSRE